MDFQEAFFDELEKISAAVEVLFHGSPRSVKELSPRREHGDPKVEDVVFATPSRAFALAYTGKKWGDRDMEQSTYYNKDTGEEDEMVLREMRPGAFRDIYAGRKGYLYHLPAKGFRYVRPRNPWEQTIPSVVLPAKIEIISDALKALKADPKVRMIPYDPEAEENLTAFKRQAARMREMPPEEATRYRQWRLRKAPPEARRFFV